MTTKCLFRVLDTHTKKLLPGNYEKKSLAKKRRDELNTPDEYRYVIVLGPDHFRYKG